MPIDASIYGLIKNPQLEGPMDQYGKAMTVRNLVGQGRLQDMQLQQAERAIAEDMRLRDLFSRGVTPSVEDVYAASPQFGPKWQKSQLENKKLLGETENQRLDALRKRVELYHGAYKNVNDQGAHTAWRERFAAEVPELAQYVPEQFSPQGKLNLLSTGEQFVKRLTPNFQIVDIGGKKVSVDTNPVTNPAIKDLQLDITKSPNAPVTNITFSTEKEYGEKFAGQIAAQDAAMRDAANKAPDLANRANSVLETLSSRKIITGIGADIRLQIGKALNLAGASDAEVIANTEVLATDLAKNTLDAIKASGLGGGTGFSNADRDFLEKAVGGKITLEAKTIERLAVLAHRAAEKSAQKWGERAGRIPRSVLEGTGISPEPPKVPPLFKAPQQTGGAQFTPEQIEAEARRRGLIR